MPYYPCPLAGRCRIAAGGAAWCLGSAITCLRVRPPFTLLPAHVPRCLEGGGRGGTLLPQAEGRHTCARSSYLPTTPAGAAHCLPLPSGLQCWEVVWRILGRTLISYLHCDACCYYHWEGLVQMGCSSWRRAAAHAEPHSVRLPTVPGVLQVRTPRLPDYLSASGGMLQGRARAGVHLRCLPGASWGLSALSDRRWEAQHSGLLPPVPAAGPSRHR